MISNTEALPAPRLVRVTHIPMQTSKGTIWMHPIRPPKRRGAYNAGPFNPCEHCPLESQCHEAVQRGDFIACERPLEREIMTRRNP